MYRWYITSSLFPASKLQWAPTLTSHDPNPPLPLESEAATGAGVGSAAGSSTVAGIGAATTAASGSAAGSGAATGVSASTVASVGEATGTSTASGASLTIIQGVGASAGASTVSGASDTGAGVGSAAGSSTVSGVGATDAASVGLASGAATAEAISAVAEAVTGHSNLPDPSGGDEASIEYWRQRQREQNEAVQKIMRGALERAAEAAPDEEETAEQLADIVASSFIPATTSAGELQRFAAMLEDEEDIELLLMAIA